jgi:hypothetical protein
VIVLKVVGIIAVVLIVSVVLIFGGGLWMIRSAQADRQRSIETLTKEFPVGAEIAPLISRAEALKAGGFGLNMPNTETGELGAQVAMADSTFDRFGSGRDEKYRERVAALKAKFAEMPSGALSIDFPVFLNARWIFNATFDAGKVTAVRSVYLD